EALGQRIAPNSEICVEYVPQLSKYWHAAALNYEGNARCHVDQNDALHCCVIVLGSFTDGGDFVLWELKQRIKLYPGDAIFSQAGFFAIQLIHSQEDRDIAACSSLTNLSSTVSTKLIRIGQ